MFTQENGDPSKWRVPTDLEKIAAFGAPVIVLADPDSSLTRSVGLDYIDNKPVSLDILYNNAQNRVLQVKNVRKYKSVGYDDIMRTALIEFLLNNRYFRRESDSGKKDELDRASEAHELMRQTDPAPAELHLDGKSHYAEAVHIDGYTAIVSTPGQQTIVVIGPDERAPHWELRTLS